MVLQRQTEIPVWGVAGSGALVKAELNGLTGSAIAASDGAWELMLPAMSEGGPYEFTLQSGKDTLVYTDVYVGDVWLASGQSNMAMMLKECDKAAQEIAGSDYPEIRHFNVTKYLGNEPRKNLPAGSMWTPATPEYVGDFTGVGYYYAKYLYKYLDVPVGIINASYGGARIETWMSKEMLGYDEQDIVFGDGEAWLQPTLAYNNMLHPLLRFPIKGMIWYQGESNMGSRETALMYSDQLKKLINSWRELWGMGEIPFIWVQIPNTGNESDENSPGTWDALPMLREAQSRVLSLPNTGEVISIDTGEPDIHPTNKEPVGERLSLVARSLTYGDTIIFSGPRYRSFRKLDNGRIEISFDHEGGGLVARETADFSLRWFAMAGSNGTFYKASAVLDSNRVVVWNNGITDPEYIRYAYESNPFNVNFYNAEGLPAAPFKLRVKHPGFFIQSFKATDYSLDKGESTLLTWQVYGTDEVRINQMKVDSIGGIRVWPHSDSTFTLRITNRDQPELVESVSLTIYVKEPDPTISLSTDAGEFLSAGSEVLIHAEVSAPYGGSISLVEFQVNGAVIDSVSLAPFETTWTPDSAGTYFITGIVTNHRGMSQISDTLRKVVDHYNTLNYEAEDARITGRYYILEDEGVSKGLYSDLYRDWTISFDSIMIEKEGEYQLTIAFMLNYGSPQIQDLYLNGDLLEPIVFESPEADAWNKHFMMIQLQKENNQLALKSGGGPMSIDYISFLVEQSITGPNRITSHLSGKNKLMIFPNPVSGSTRISFNLHEQGAVLVELFDLSGRNRGIITKGVFSPGNHEITYRADGLKRGVYFLHFSYKSQKSVKKMLVL